MYKETPAQQCQRETAFTYHPPRFPSQGIRYGAIREHAKRLSAFLNELCPASRELSLAQTKLEEAVFWANAAIARNEMEDPSARDG